MLKVVLREIESGIGLMVVSTELLIVFFIEHS